MAASRTVGTVQATSTRELALALRDVVLNGDLFQQARAARLGLGHTDLIALGHVHLAGPLTPSELAARLGLTTGSITPLLDRVQAAGFVVRELNPNDRRSLLVRTTPEGEAAMDEMYDVLDAVARDTVEASAHVDAQTAHEVFRKAAQALRGRAK